MRIQTLGGLSAYGTAGPLTGEAAQPRRLALLALLVWARDRGMSRDKLVSFIWPDADEERARRILSQALYSLRKGIGSEDVVLGTQELRLNPAIITSDLAEFELARREGNLARAAELFAGPFLDGFHLPGAPDFERWADESRAALSHDLADLLEQLATDAERTGDMVTAVGWWRKLAALDPLNARVAIALMRALAGAGDRAGALRHARIYQALVEQELDLPADRDVVALAEALRATPEAPASPPIPVASPRPIVAEADPKPAVAEPEQAAAPAAARATAPRRHMSLRGVLTLAAAVAGVAAILWLVRSPDPAPMMATIDAGGGPVLMVGRIVDYGGDHHPALGRPLADMVATDLARSPNLHVVSAARVYELLAQLHQADTLETGFMRAARQAGATELLDGALYDLGGGRIRLDLRRVEVRSGRVLGAYSVEGSDPFQLADSLTGHLVRALGATRPHGMLADVTTRSIAAYQDYEAGLQSYYNGNLVEAERSFGTALGTDSGFAMAAYYHALVAADPGVQLARMDVALRLAAHASDRERLIISATWALMNQAPSGRALAETLAVRYPTELDGHLLLGYALSSDEDYPGGVASFRRVLAMDSLSLHGGQTRCRACDAAAWIVADLVTLDSFPAALSAAADWTRMQERNPTAWRTLANMRDLVGDTAGGVAAYRRAAELDTSSAQRYADRRRHVMVAERYAEAERLNADRLDQLIGADERVDVMWDRILIQQQRGRFQDALGTAMALRRGADGSSGEEREGSPLAVTMAVAQAELLRENGRDRESIALLDTVAGLRRPAGSTTHDASTQLWILTMLARVLAESGDTLRLALVADSMTTLARLSGSRRDQEHPHYARGLLLAARGQMAQAESEFALGAAPVVDGFSPDLVQRARMLRRLGRNADAVRLLQQTLRGGYHFYMTHAELHAELAEAWAAAGNRDSAQVQMAAAERAWVEADAPARVRLSRRRAALGL